MKILAMMLFIFAAPSAFANGYGMAGCGLGSMVMPQQGAANQILAATTNGTFLSQPFGVTSGTLNCLTPGQSAMLEGQQKFFASNVTALSKEMSQGEGEYLRAFAQTFGCSTESFTDFSAELKSNYKEIFAKPGMDVMFQQVRGVINNSETLNSSCNKLV